MDPDKRIVLSANDLDRGTVVSEPDGPAGTYIALMQYDVNEIVQALLE